MHYSELFRKEIDYFRILEALEHLFKICFFFVLPFFIVQIVVRKEAKYDMELSLLLQSSENMTNEPFGSPEMKVSRE